MAIQQTLFLSLIHKKIQLEAQSIRYSNVNSSWCTDLLNNNSISMQSATNTCTQQNIIVLYPTLSEVQLHFVSMPIELISETTSKLRLIQLEIKQLNTFTQNKTRETRMKLCIKRTTVTGISSYNSIKHILLLYLSVWHSHLASRETAGSNENKW